MFVGQSPVSRDTLRGVTGTTTEWHAGESIAVGSD